MKRVRFGIIGCGGFAGWHAKRISEGVPELECVGLADIVPEKAEKMGEAYFGGKPAVFTDYRKMLNAVKPEGVIVSPPHTLHYPMARDVIASGAHVLVDKPMVTSSEDAKRLVRQAKRRKRVLGIAIQGTYTDTFAYARQLLTDGTMGKLQLVTGMLSQDWMEFTKGTWRQDPKQSGGGQLYDSSCHMLSAMLYLVNSRVTEAFCWADSKGRKVDVNAVGVIRFANGCMATATSGGNCASWKSLLILQGEKARMEISPHGGEFLVTGRGFKEPITAVPKGWKVPTVTPAKNFADAIRGKAEVRCGGWLGILLAELMDALYASVKSGKAVRPKR